MPKRGIAALAITAFALVLLLSFKTPDVVPARGGGVAIVEPGHGDAVSGDRRRRPAPARPLTRRRPRRRRRGAATTRPPPPRSTAPSSTRATAPVQVEIVVSGGQLTGRRRDPAPDRSPLGPDLERRGADPPRGGAPGKERSRSTRSRAPRTPATHTRSRSRPRSTRRVSDERRGRRRAALGRARHGHDRQHRGRAAAGVGGGHRGSRRRSA